MDFRGQGNSPVALSTLLASRASAVTVVTVPLASTEVIFRQKNRERVVSTSLQPWREDIKYQDLGGLLFVTVVAFRK